MNDPALAARTRFELESLFALFLSLFFFGTGIAKIAGTDFIAATFGGWDYPITMLYALGVIEILAAALATIPATRRLGAGIIALVMIGAVGYHLTRVELALLPLPLVMLALSSGLLLIGRVDRVARPDELRPSGA